MTAVIPRLYSFVDLVCLIYSVDGGLVIPEAKNKNLGEKPLVFHEIRDLLLDGDIISNTSKLALKPNPRLIIRT